MTKSNQNCEWQHATWQKKVTKSECDHLKKDNDDDGCELCKSFVLFIAPSLHGWWTNEQHNKMIMTKKI